MILECLSLKTLWLSGSVEKQNSHSLSQKKKMTLLITLRRWHEKKEVQVKGAASQCVQRFSLLRLVLLHGLQFKWETFMMQMRAGAINLPLPASPGLPRCQRCALSLFLTRSGALSPLAFSALLHRLTFAPRPHEKWIRPRWCSEGGLGRGGAERRRKGEEEEEKKDGLDFPQQLLGYLSLVIEFVSQPQVIVIGQTWDVWFLLPVLIPILSQNGFWSQSFAVTRKCREGWRSGSERRHRNTGVHILLENQGRPILSWTLVPERHWSFPKTYQVIFLSQRCV